MNGITLPARTIVAGVLALGLIFAISISVSFESRTAAQEPITPVPPGGTPQTTCQLPLQRATGGETISFGNIQVTLPGGYDYVWGPLAVDPGGAAITICIAQFNSQVTISTE